MEVTPVEFEGWSNCLRISNAEIEVVLATEIGLRILRFGFTGGPNAFYLDPVSLGNRGGSEWKIYGGHRLWHAPETFPGSYTPDNGPVGYRMETNSVIVTQPKDPATGLIKEMEISFGPGINTVRILHRLINHNSFSLTLAPWAISVMTPGGTAFIPQEPYGEGNDYLLPARTLALWSYTRMSDKRWTWGDRYIRANHENNPPGEQKIGICNAQGWAAYFFSGHCFIKKFAFDNQAVYADRGCNNEIYFNEAFLEIESLGPLTTLFPDQAVVHREEWFLNRQSCPGSEEEADLAILPRITVSR